MTEKIQDPERVVHGEEGDELFVDETTRICALCNTVKVLQQFYYRPDTKTTSLACRACCKENKKLTTQLNESKTATMLVGALSKASGRRALAELGPSLGSALKEMVSAWGGEAPAFRKMAEITMRAMENNDVEIAMKAVKMMLDAMAAAQKLTPEPVDISSLSAEDLNSILMEPAKAMVMDDEEFRAQLLNDPEVRARLLLDAGVNVIESDADVDDFDYGEDVPE